MKKPSGLRGAAKTAGLCGFGLFFCLCLLFLYGCGDIDVTLPRKGTYKIKALVNNMSLDENSLVWAGDKIRPYCDSSLSKDPDVSGLLVLIQNAEKETVGGGIHYTLKNPDDFDYVLPEEDVPEQEEIPADLEVEEETATEVVAEEEYTDVEEYEIVVEAEQEAEEVENLFADSESFVEGETFEDTPPLPITEIEDKVFIVSSLDVQLPAFTIPEDIEVGLYTLVFRVLGDKETFSETEQSFFYLGNSRFDLKDLNLYLPGVYAESQLIRPGTKVLLEAVIETERNINPYIVWYNGKKIIEQGFISDGMGVIFFEAPEQNALQTLRAEIFPTQTKQGLSGVSREIVLPVSAKAGGPEFFSGTALADFSSTMTEESDEPSELPGPKLMHWYQFAGTLNDANDFSGGGRNKLVPVVDRQPRFSPMDNTYGLSTGAYEAYTLPGISFVQTGEENGGGVFLFRIKPASAGGILNVIFDTPPAAHKVSMHLLVEEEYLVLRLNAGEDLTSEMAIPTGKGAKGAHVTAALMFYLLPDRLEAKLIPAGKSPEQVEAIYVRLREPLNGKCSVRLGSQNVSAREAGQNRGGDQGRQRNGRRHLPASAIWNELAVFYLPPSDFDLLEPEEVDVADNVPEQAVVTNTTPAAAAEPPAVEVKTEAAAVTEEVEAKQAGTDEAEVQNHAVETPEIDINDKPSNEPENV